MNNALTEKDALTKWCPFASTPPSLGGDNPRLHPAHTRQICCVASQCMAWRWSGTVKDPTGYCGLAGP